MAARSAEQLAAHLRDLRLGAELTQEQVADHLDVDTSAVPKIENGSRGVGVAELAAYAELFGISVDQLLFEEAQEEIFMRADSAAEIEAARRTADELIDDVLYLRALVG